MCGRYTLDSAPERIARYFRLDQYQHFQPRYNIPPGTDVPVIRLSPEGKRVLHLLRWGLVPHWSKEPSIGAKLNNARAESVAEKPSFRSAFQRRRCLIPADGFYEWKAEGPSKQPYYISLKSKQPMAFGGLWESWKAADGSLLRTACIVTTSANQAMAPIHDRMPVLLQPEDWNLWLEGSAEQASTLLHPCADELIQTWPVSRRVNRIQEDDAGLVAPIVTFRLM